MACTVFMPHIRMPDRPALILWLLKPNCTSFVDSSESDDGELEISIMCTLVTALKNDHYGETPGNNYISYRLFENRFGKNGKLKAAMRNRQKRNIFMKLKCLWQARELEIVF